MKLKSPAAGSRGYKLPRIQATRTLAESQLRQASVRITPVRVKVLAALLGASRAFSHQDVQETFADTDRVTLYRTLDCLTEAGLAHKISGDDRISRYSAGRMNANQDSVSPSALSDARHQHGHFKCTRCAKIFCLEKAVSVDSTAGTSPVTAQRQLTLRLQDEIRKTLGNGFRSHAIELTIKGWCAECAH